MIADTHLPRGARRLPDACVEELRRAELILHAGDLKSAGFLEELRSFGPPVRAVHGNADEPAVRELLPATATIDVGGARIAIIHDPGRREGREERLAARFPDCAAVVYGHTHLPQVERRSGVWILNPGSPTERRRGPFCSMLRLEIDGPELRPELVRLP